MPPPTGAPPAVFTVAVTVGLVARTTTRDGETVAVVVVSAVGFAVAVAGMTTVVPLGRAVTTNVEPAGMVAGAVNETVAPPAVTGNVPRAVSVVPVFMATSTVVFAGAPSEVRSSLVRLNETASPASTDSGNPAPYTCRRAKLGSSAGDWWLPR